MGDREGVATQSVPPPGFAERPSPAPVAPPAPEPVQPLRGENRRALDGRRVGAALIDAVAVGLPLALVLQWQFGENTGTAVLALALLLVYHHLCEVTTGQTLGKRINKLRVATWDGATPGPAPAAARNVLRPIEVPLIALIVMVCSGRRRQRIGDLFAGTIVIDARVHPGPQAQWRTSFVVYPLLWLVPAIAVFALATQGKTPGTYRFDAERVCSAARQAALRPPYRGDINAQLTFLDAEVQGLARMRVPRDWAVRHRILVERRLDQLEVARRLARGTRSTNRAAVHRWSLRLWSAAAVDRRALQDMGFRSCAGPGVI